MQFNIQTSNKSFSILREKRNRERHYAWIQANELTRIKYVSLEKEWVYAQRRKDVEKMTALAHEYATFTQDKKIVLYGENSKDRYFRFIKYSHRLQKEHMTTLIRQLNRYCKPLKKYNTVYFVTLTIDFKAYDSIYEGYKDATRQFNSLITRLRTINKQHGLKPLYYVRVAEIQEKNTQNIHFHVLLGVDDRYLYDGIYEYIKNNWGIGFFDLKEVKYDLEIHHMKSNVIGYMAKYLRKTADPENTDAWGFSSTQVVLWALNARQISHARLDNADRRKTNSNGRYNSDFLDPEDPIEWIYLGAFPLGLPAGIYKESDLEENSEILSLFYRRKYSKSIKIRRDMRR
jgi:hypothetical protein